MSSQDLPDALTGAAALAAVTLAASCRAQPSEPEPVSIPAHEAETGPAALEVNGTRHTLELAGRRSLLDVLRNELGLTGTKYGCGEGQCGACTVLVDDRAIRSCVRSANSCEGHRVTTIEGLAAADDAGAKLHVVQEAFIAEQAMQCGYCTPGMIMAAVGLLRATPKPSDEDIRAGMRHNICRCGTYPRIARAVRRASREETG